MVSTVEKHAREIKIFALSRGFQAQISRSGAQKGIFIGQYASGLEEPTFSTESAGSGLSRRAAGYTRLDPACPATYRRGLRGPEGARYRQPAHR